MCVCVWKKLAVKIVNVYQTIHIVFKFMICIWKYDYLFTGEQIYFIVQSTAVKRLIFMLTPNPEHK